jgi:predicted transcriptional regulator of viral defense system
MSVGENNLFAIVEEQQGYFTSAQAVACGYPTSNHVYHVKTGAWKRMHRGIYRLVRYPHSDDEQYVLWSLWSRNRRGEPQGIYSHQTALSLFDLSDLMPPKLHMTVPSSFRRNVPIPDILVLHKGTMSPIDIESRQGYRVTRPLKAITDLLEERAVSMEHLRQAAQQALAKGLITRSQVEAHPVVSELLMRSPQ